MQPEAKPVDEPGLTLSDEAGTVTLDGYLVISTPLVIDPKNDLVIAGRINCEAISGVRQLSIPVHGEFTGLVCGETATIEGGLTGKVEIEGTAFVRRTARIRGEVAGGIVKVEQGTNLEHCVLSGRIQRA